MSTVQIFKYTEPVFMFIADAVEVVMFMAGGEFMLNIDLQTNLISIYKKYISLIVRRY